MRVSNAPTSPPGVTHLGEEIPVTHRGEPRKPCHPGWAAGRDGIAHPTLEHSASVLSRATRVDVSG